MPESKGYYLQNGYGCPIVFHCLFIDWLGLYQEGAARLQCQASGPLAAFRQAEPTHLHRAGFRLQGEARCLDPAQQVSHCPGKNQLYFSVKLWSPLGKPFKFVKRSPLRGNRLDRWL